MRLEKSLQMKNTKTLKIEDEESEGVAITGFAPEDQENISDQQYLANASIEDLLQHSKAMTVVKVNQNQNYSVPRAARGKKLSTIVNPPSIVSKPEKDETLVVEST